MSGLKFISCKAKNLPARAACGAVYHTTDTNEVWIAIKGGQLIPLSEMFAGLSNALQMTVGPAGAPGRDGRDGTAPELETIVAAVLAKIRLPRDGQDGQTVIGPRGERGEIGPQGLPGRSAPSLEEIVSAVVRAIPKPKDGADGQQGPQGPPGDITVVGDAELRAAVGKLKEQKARATAALLEGLLSSKNLSPHAQAQVKQRLNDVLAELNR